MKIDRRDFLSAAAATAAGAAFNGLAGRAHAAVDVSDIRVAVIGVRNQGRSHVRDLGGNLAALCDADSGVLDSAGREISERMGADLATYADYRELIASKDIDAVSIATPNHTHVAIAIAAMAAGKDVYCEKPVSHNVWEGRQLVAAARKYGRIVQCGTQSRSSPSLNDAVQWVRSGQLGAVEYALGTCYKPRKPIGRLEDPLSLPKSLDYNLWCGPAEERDLFRPQLHYDWHWDWNTGNGDMGNQGIHQMDIARWFLGESDLAPRTTSIGGRLGYEDAGDTPNTQLVVHEYESAPLVFETRGLPRSKSAQRSWGSMMDRYRGSKVGVIVQCEGGHVLVPSYTEAIAYDRAGKPIKTWKGGANHHANWLQAIAAGDPGILNAEIREGHISSALCHTGGVSQLLGEAATADEISERLKASPLVSASFDRMAAHLRANDVDIDSGDGALLLGPTLEIDPATEAFAGNDAANGLRKRADQRAEFAVPDLGA
ncbi:MAG: Gfo/Idh/MocA family oxidoreductase [Planctomycetota bacterium]